jgi:hypothetical protein
LYSGAEVINSFNNLDSLRSLSLQWFNIENSLNNLRTAIHIGIYGYPGTDIGILPSLSGNVFGFQISECPNISSLEGFPSMDTIRVFSVRDNPSLLSLNGLDFKYSESEFNVRDNPVLKDFCAISNVEIGNGVYIIGNAFNPSLNEILEGKCSIK